MPSTIAVVSNAPITTKWYAVAAIAAISGTMSTG
jgi:hypothetical protein